MSQRAPQPFLGRAVRGATLAIALVLPFTACVTTNLAPLHDAAFSPEEDEAELWKQAHATAARLDAQRVQDAALQSYLDRILSRLLGDDLDRFESKPRVRVLPGTELNAFALADGSLYVYSTLLTALSSEDQVAAVLGHELTHFTHRHEIRTQRSATNQQRGIGTVSIVTGAILMNPLIARDVYDLWTVAAVGGYSRDLEREADDAGFARAVRAGYAPAELIAAFELFRDAAARAGENTERAPFYASHPAMSERVAHYRELANASPANRRPEPGRNAHREAIAAAQAGNARAHLLALNASEAAASLASYRELRPGDAEGHFLEGWLSRVEGGSIEAALVHYRAATSADPTHVDAWRRIGLLERRRHDSAAAREPFHRVLELAPDAPDAGILAKIAESGFEPPAALPKSATRFGGIGPRRVIVTPVRVVRGLEVDPARRRELEADLADVLRSRGYEVIDASVYASLADSFEHSVRERRGADRYDSVPDDWIHDHVRNELFARYDAEALLVPIIDAERARVEGGTMYCNDAAQQLPMDPDATQWDWDAGAQWLGTGPAMSLLLVAENDLGRPFLSGKAPCQPLARIDSNGYVRDFPPSRRLADRATRREAAEKAVSRLKPLPADGS